METEEIGGKYRHPPEASGAGYLHIAEDEPGFADRFKKHLQLGGFHFNAGPRTPDANESSVDFLQVPHLSSYKGSDFE
jgi:hypothetical protein